MLTTTASPLPTSPVKQLEQVFVFPPDMITSSSAAARTSSTPGAESAQYVSFTEITRHLDFLNMPLSELSPLAVEKSLNQAQNEFFRTLKIEDRPELFKNAKNIPTDSSENSINQRKTLIRNFLNSNFCGSIAAQSIFLSTQIMNMGWNPAIETRTFFITMFKKMGITPSMGDGAIEIEFVPIKNGFLQRCSQTTTTLAYEAPDPDSMGFSDPEWVAKYTARLSIFKRLQQDFSYGGTYSKLFTLHTIFFIPLTPGAFITCQDISIEYHSLPMLELVKNLKNALKEKL